MVGAFRPLLYLVLVLSGFNLAGSNVLLISSNHTGRATGNAQSAELAVTPDGRYVAFTSYASDLGGVDTNGNSDVYLLDRATGVRTCISSPTNFPPTVPAFAAQNPAISDDGRFVGFGANHSRLVPEITNYPPSRPWNFFVYDRVANQYVLGSPNGHWRSAFPQGVGNVTLSSDGRLSSFMIDLDLYRGDLEAGTSTRVNVDLNGNAVPMSNVRAVTPDHQYFVFSSTANNVVSDPPKTDQTLQVYCRDMTLGVTKLVSVATNGSYAATNCFTRAISPDGRYVAFRSRARNLQGGMGGGSGEDVFIRDMAANETWCVTVNASGTGSLGNSFGIQDMQFSGDGNRFLFPTVFGLLPGTLYVHDVNWRMTRLLATNTFAEVLRLSENGRYALYSDSARTLMSVDVETLRRQRIGRLGGWSPPSSAVRISADGRWTFFTSHTNEAAGVSDSNGQFSDLFAAPTISPRIESVSGTGPRMVEATAFPADSIQLQRSSDLVIWDTLATLSASGDGTVTLQDSGGVNSNAFYRLRSP